MLQNEMKKHNLNISANVAILVQVAPLRRIDEDINRFPAAIPLIISWLFQK